MNTINYFRVLMNAKCEDCTWTGHDCDCEHYNFNETSPGQIFAELIKICPLCSGRNITIESWEAPTVKDLND